MEKSQDSPARKIKFLMRNYSMTVQSLSEKVGVTTECLRHILNEEEIPTPHILYQICGLFNLNESFFGDALRPQSKSAAQREDGLLEIPGGAKHMGQMTMAADRLLSEIGGKMRKSLNERHRKTLDLADLAARQQVILDLLISKKVFTKSEYDTRLEILRAKVLSRQQGR